MTNYFKKFTQLIYYINKLFSVCVSWGGGGNVKCLVNKCGGRSKGPDPSCESTNQMEPRELQLLPSRSISLLLTLL